MILVYKSCWLTRRSLYTTSFAAPHSQTSKGLRSGLWGPHGWSVASARRRVWNNRSSNRERHGQYGPILHEPCLSHLVREQDGRDVIFKFTDDVLVAHCVDRACFFFFFKPVRANNAMLGIKVTVM